MTSGSFRIGDEACYFELTAGADGARASFRISGLTGEWTPDELDVALFADDLEELHETGEGVAEMLDDSTFILKVTLPGEGRAWARLFVEGMAAFGIDGPIHLDIKFDRARLPEIWRAARAAFPGTPLFDD